MGFEKFQRQAWLSRVAQTKVACPANVRCKPGTSFNELVNNTESFGTPRRMQFIVMGLFRWSEEDNNKLGGGWCRRVSCVWRWEREEKDISQPLAFYVSSSPLLPLQPRATELLFPDRSSHRLQAEHALLTGARVHPGQLYPNTSKITYRGSGESVQSRRGGTQKTREVLGAKFSY